MSLTSFLFLIKLQLSSNLPIYFINLTKLLHIFCFIMLKSIYKLPLIKVIVVVF